jgi:hypothetical protein
LAGRGGQAVAIQNRQRRERFLLFHHYGGILIGNRRENRGGKLVLRSGNVCIEFLDGRVERGVVFPESSIGPTTRTIGKLIGKHSKKGMLFYPLFDILPQKWYNKTS